MTQGYLLTALQRYDAARSLGATERDARESTAVWLMIHFAELRSDAAAVALADALAVRATYRIQTQGE